MRMKRIITLLLFLLPLLAGYAQNPFAAYGYKPKMATLSNGRFDEFHDKNQIVEIGSIKFDTKTNKIVGLVEPDTLNTAMDVQTVSRFVSIDPHAERYYSISPYAYCNNNPVNCIDPDGRDWYRHNETGNYYWQEGHDELDGYTNIGSSVSIQLGEDSYLNYYQNGGIWANQAVDAFDLIRSSPKLQKQFLERKSVLSAQSQTELFNSLNSRDIDKFARPIGEALVKFGASELGGVLAGKLIGWGAEWISNLSSTSIRGGELFKFSVKAAEHMQESGRYVPIQVLEQAIKSSKGVADPRGSSALMHTVEMWRNGKAYQLEVLYDKSTNTIWHFKYK